jgi:hypothetical protein
MKRISLFAIVGLCLCLSNSVLAVPTPIITNTSPLTTGFVNVAYSETLLATGATPPYTWSILPGPGLPPGLSLDTSSGLISGTPTIATNASFMVRVSKGAVGSISTFSLTILPGPISSPLPTGTVGWAYTTTLPDNGGVAPYLWYVVNGNLPTGLGLMVTNGVISGTPTVVTNSQTFDIMVMDSVGVSSTNTFSLTIIPSVAPVITSTTLPEGELGIAYNFTLTAISGTVPYTWTYVPGSPPPTGLNLDPDTGIIYGIPTVATNAQAFSVVVTGGDGASSTNIFYLTITNPPIITSPSMLPSGTLGSPYNFTFTATGGATPYSWTCLDCDLLQRGLQFSDTGVISGTPSNAVSGDILEVGVWGNDGLFSTETFSLTINNSVAPVIFTAGLLPTGNVAVAYNVSLFANGGVAPYTWSILPGTQLPDHLTLSSSTGVISGTPTAPVDNQTFGIVVTGNDGAASTNTFIITITNIPVITTPSSLPAGTVGTPYSFSLTAIGSDTPYWWGLVPTSYEEGLGLPPGLALSGDGVISGIPVLATNQWTVFIEVTGSPNVIVPNSGTSGNFFTLTINPAPAPVIVSTSPLVPGTVGAPYSFSLYTVGGTPPYTYSLVSGDTWPAGLGVDANTGIISGTPTLACNNHTSRVVVTDSLGASVMNTFSLNVIQYAFYDITPPGIHWAAANSIDGTNIAGCSLKHRSSGGWPDNDVLHDIEGATGSKFYSAPYVWTVAGVTNGVPGNNVVVSGWPCTPGNLAGNITSIHGTLAIGAMDYTLLGNGAEILDFTGGDESDYSTGLGPWYIPMTPHGSAVCEPPCVCSPWGGWDSAALSTDGKYIVGYSDDWNPNGLGGAALWSVKAGTNYTALVNSYTDLRGALNTLYEQNPMLAWFDLYCSTDYCLGGGIAYAIRDDKAVGYIGWVRGQPLYAVSWNLDASGGLQSVDTLTGPNIYDNEGVARGVSKDWVVGQCNNFASIWHGIYTHDAGPCQGGCGPVEGTGDPDLAYFYPYGLGPQFGLHDAHADFSSSEAYDVNKGLRQAIGTVNRSGVNGNRAVVWNLYDESLWGLYAYEDVNYYNFVEQWYLYLPPGWEVDLMNLPCTVIQGESCIVSIDDQGDIVGWISPADGTTKAVLWIPSNQPLPTGGLQVNITPYDAVAAGAQWQLDGGAWHNSGDTVSALVIGSHYVTFSTIAANITPSAQTVTIVANQTKAITGTYGLTSGTGSIQVNITPSDAVSAGAQWQVDGGLWQNIGDTVSGLSAGSHTVSFSGIDAWVTPSDQTVTVTATQTSTVSGTYVSIASTGAILANINPSDAVNAGAMWQVDGGDWQTSGSVVPLLSAGSHTVAFNSISGWTTPSSQIITVTATQTNTVTGTYVLAPAAGAIQVNIAPGDAVSGGAMWQVDAGAWQNSGSIVSGLSVGSHTVAFNSINNWIAPSSQPVTVTGGQTNTVTVTYAPRPIALQITGILKSGSDILVTWQTPLGATNALEATTGSGGYSASGFTGIFSVTNTVTTTTNYLDKGVIGSTPSRYYRVRLVP